MDPLDFFKTTAFLTIHWTNLVMIVVGAVFISLAIVKHYEPLLLVPIGFGIIVGNIPSVPGMALSVYDAGGIEVRHGRVVTQVVTNQHNKPVMKTVEDSDGKTQQVPQERVAAQMGSVLSYIYFGVQYGIFPPLIFLGIGAMTDFSTMLSNPKLVLLGAAAQVGVFLTLLGALFLNFTPEESGAIGIIGGADGPTAIFLSTKLAPNLLGAIAIAAYSYMALVPVIQPPIMKLLTTRQERLIRMPPPRRVSRRERIIFPVAAFLICAMIAPASIVLLGMLFFGNLLKESCVTDRLAQTARTALIDIVTIVLGFAVGASTQAQTFLTPQSLGIFALGAASFAIATAGGVLFAKAMNLVLKQKINPLLGAAGVSAVPDSARVVQMVGHREDPHNHLLMHAMAPNVAGVIGSAVAAGVLWSVLTQ
jgi:sodium ion-translocating decarboxylase beta subunit